MFMKNSIHKQSGFTLVELLVTVAIAAIVLSVAVPSMRDIIQNSRISSVTNELVSALMVARSEAIRQNAMACVCPSVTTRNAVPACVASGNWESGWIAFSDFNGDCVINGAAPTADVLLKVWDGTQYINQITVRTNSPSINAVNSVRFNDRGAPVANGATQNGNFSICDNRPISGIDAQGDVRMAAAVIVNAAGRSRASRQAAQITYTAP